MEHAVQLTLEQCIARKLMVDIRLFDSGEGPQPVQALPAALAAGLAALQPAGVILFRENLASVDQVRALTAAVRRCIEAPALIGIDQEGGAVTRLPRDACTSFSGNMALAACADAEALAGAMARAQAAELAALGININFAPTLDVNSNPANPVIHVRAFGDQPARVAQLGGAVVRGLQAGGVAAAIKHFPGHGDTAEDSHSHLPCVRRSPAQARQLDLAPFAEVIACCNPQLVMSAHIQYPALDPSTLEGSATLRPATLSRAMMTDLLRAEMGFAGVVISDALDMGAIAGLMTPERAVIECFRAGVDIALMPLLLRSPASLGQLGELVAAVAGAVRRGELDEAELRASAARVCRLQQALAGSADGADRAAVGCAEHRALERRIAEASITRVSGAAPALVAGSRVHLLMPSAATARALRAALLAEDPSLALSWQSLEAFDPAREAACLADAQAYLVGVAEPAPSAVTLGGAEDLGELSGLRPGALQQAMLARAAGRQRVVLMLSSPYPASEFAALADAVLASYDGAAPGPAYGALAAVLCGRLAARGRLPVSLPG